MTPIDPTIAQMDELAFRLVFGFVCFFAGAVIVGGLIWGERTLALTFWRAEFERVLRMTTQNVESPRRWARSRCRSSRRSGGGCCGRSGRTTKIMHARSDSGHGSRVGGLAKFRRAFERCMDRLVRRSGPPRCDDCGRIKTPLTPREGWRWYACPWCETYAAIEERREWMLQCMATNDRVEATRAKLNMQIQIDCGRICPPNTD